MEQESLIPVALEQDDDFGTVDLTVPPSTARLLRRKGATVRQATGTSNVLFFLTIALTVTGMSVAALRYAEPDAPKRPAASNVVMTRAPEAAADGVRAPEPKTARASLVVPSAPVPREAPPTQAEPEPERAPAPPTARRDEIPPPPPAAEPSAPRKETEAPAPKASSGKSAASAKAEVARTRKAAPRATKTTTRTRLSVKSDPYAATGGDWLPELRK